MCLILFQLPYFIVQEYYQPKIMIIANLGCYSELEMLDVLDIFDEEYWLDVWEAVYDCYEPDLPPDVAEKRIEYERQLKEKPESDEYAAYLTEYYSAWLEDYEVTQQTC